MSIIGYYITEEKGEVMGFFSRLFKRKDKIENNVLKKETPNEECLKLLEI